MRYLCVLVVGALLAPSVAGAQSLTLQVQVGRQTSHVIGNMNLRFSRPLGESNWNAYVFGLVSPNWGELRSGLSYGRKTVIGYVRAGASLGVETNAFFWRGDVFLFWSNPGQRWKLLIDIERGGSGWWHVGYLKFCPTPPKNETSGLNFWLGIQSQRFYFSGGIVELGHKALTLWVGAGPALFRNDRPLHNCVWGKGENIKWRPFGGTIYTYRQHYCCRFLFFSFLSSNSSPRVFPWR